MKYTPTIGLEIHAELKTNSKMFCGCKNDPLETRPNINICPVCMAHPGTLPVINKEAVKHVLRVGKAISGQQADFTEFDRKNYFYPDIPKGYQISQYQYPLISNGELVGVDVTRIHLEEDTARNIHKGEDSLIDYNRAGVPLMELVTEPVIKDADTAMHFARELQLLLRYLGVSDADMEKGQMRVEANISVSEDEQLGTKVEVKNLNSFRAVGRAIEYEIKRHIKALDSGEEIVQETRGWDDGGQKTFSQRKKESSHDYRYFPDPDLPKLSLSEVEAFQHIDLPELPWEKRERYQREYGIKKEDIESFVADSALAAFFEEAITRFEGNRDLVARASNYITSDIAGHLVQGATLEHIKPEAFATLMEMAAGGQLSSRGVKDILARLIQEGGDPEEIARAEGLFQKSDTGELQGVVDEIIAENESVVADYKAGKEAALQYLVGQGMKLTKGSANPEVLRELLQKTIQ